MIKWTKTIEKELFKLMSSENYKRSELLIFCKEHSISERTARNKYKALLENTKKETSVETFNLELPMEFEPLLYQEVDVMMEETIKKREEVEKVLSDYIHLLENKDFSDKEYVQLAKGISTLRRERRVHKNLIEFLRTNKMMLKTFQATLKNILNYRETNKEKRYYLRSLPNSQFICENTNQKVTVLENENNALTDILINTLKQNLKTQRTLDRFQNKTVSVYKLKSNWLELYNKLDKETKEILCKEALSTYYKEYTIDNEKVKKYLLISRYLPDLLYKKGYFLKED